MNFIFVRALFSNKSLNLFRVSIFLFLAGFSCFASTPSLLAQNDPIPKLVMTTPIEPDVRDKTERLEFSKTSTNYKKALDALGADGEQEGLAYPLLLKAAKEPGAPLCVTLDLIKTYENIISNDGENSDVFKSVNKINPKQILLESLNKYPEQEDRVYSGLIYRSKSDNEKLDYYLKMADLKINSDGVARINKLLGDGEAQRGNYKNAVNRYEKSILINESLYGVKKCIVENRNKELFEKVIRVNLEQTKDFDSAIETLNRMRRAGYETNDRSNYRIGLILRDKKGDCNGAVNAFKQRLTGEKAESKLAVYLMDVGDALVTCGKQSEANSFYLRAVKIIEHKSGSVTNGDAKDSYRKTIEKIKNKIK